MGKKQQRTLPMPRLLAAAALLSAAIAPANSSTVPPTSGGSMSVVGSVLIAANFPGADAETKIANCIAALPTTGGICDARGITGPEAWGDTLVISKPVTLLLGYAVFIYSGSGDMIHIPTSAVGPITIEGRGIPRTGGQGTKLINNSAAGDGIHIQATYGSGRISVRHLQVTSTVTHATGAAINVDYGNNWTSTDVEIDDVEAYGHVVGVRIVQPIQARVIEVTASGSVDGIRLEGGTSSTFDTTYALNSGRDNYQITGEYNGFPVWRPSISYSAGYFISPNANFNGHIFKCTKVGTSGSTEPTFCTSSGCTVSDGTVIWTESGLATQLFAGDPGRLAYWRPSTAYSPNTVIAPFKNTNENVGAPTTYIYKATAAGTSGGTEPSTWCTTSGCTVTDGPAGSAVTWTEIGNLDGAAFGPTYTTLRNTASDSASRDGYRQIGGVTTYLGVGAEGGGTCFHIIKGSATFVRPYTNSCYGDGLRVELPFSPALNNIDVDVIGAYLTAAGVAGTYGVNAIGQNAYVYLIGGGSTGFPAGQTGGTGVIQSWDFGTAIAGQRASFTARTVNPNSTFILPSVTAANLPGGTNGQVFYCSDCTATAACAGGGTGAVAKRINGAWVCN